MDCPGYGVAEEGDPGWCSGRKCLIVFDERIMIFDYCTCMSGRYSVVALFLILQTVSQSFLSWHLSSPSVHMRMRKNLKSNSATFINAVQGTHADSTKSYNW